MARRPASGCGRDQHSKFTPYKLASTDDTDARLPATIIILAGGRSVRMGGRHKALLPWAGGTLLGHIVTQGRAAAREVLVVGGDGLEVPAPALSISDIFPGKGPLGGLHAGLSAASFERCVAVGCDMPFVSARILRALLDLGAGYGAAVPQAADGLHPLLAAYSRRCLPAIEERLRSDDRRLVSFLDQVRVRWVAEDELRAFDPELQCLVNINTWADYRRALAMSRTPAPTSD